MLRTMSLFFLLLFFFNDTAPTEIYPLSLHDALPISCACSARHRPARQRQVAADQHSHRGPALGENADQQRLAAAGDRKSTRLNSSHANISYAVFCLKKKKVYVMSAVCVRDDIDVVAI